MTRGLVATWAMCVTASAWAAGGWVAEPGRSLAVEWPAPAFAGRDFWMLNWEGLLEMDGIRDEPFVREGGIQCLRFEKAGGLELRNNAERGVLAVRELALFGADGGRLPPDAWTVEVSSASPGARFYHPEALQDGRSNTAFVAVGDRTRLAPDEDLPVCFTITPRDGVAAERIVFTDGLQNNARIGAADVKVRRGDAWAPAPAERRESRTQLELALSEPARGGLRIECATRPAMFAILPEQFPHQDRLAKAPFYIYMFHKRYLPTLRPSQMDRDAMAEIAQTYPNTFLGFMLSEWDSTLYGSILRLRRAPDSPAAQAIRQVLPVFTNRVEAYASVKHYYEYQKSLFHGGRIYAHSGSFTWPQYAAEWGADALEMQLSGSVQNIPDRSCLMFIRSAARQYGLPWSTYVAVFYGEGHPTFYRPGHGKPASLFLREWLMGYYLGATFFCVEGQAIGSLTLHDKQTDRYRLSPHGEAAKRFYAWTQAESGARGTSYTPMLLLADIRHGRGGRRGRAPQMDWKIWQDLEMEDGDYMFEHVVRAIDRYVDSRPVNKRPDGEPADFWPDSPERRACAESFFAALDPAFYTPEQFPAPYSQNQRNSRIGDLCDVFFANPPSQGGALRKEQLDRYAVALLMGDIEINELLAERLKTYVREGGTLVINSAQCAGELADPEFLGLTVGPDAREEDRMTVAPVALRTAEVVMASPRGTPLVTRHRYGRGHVLVTTPRYLLLNDRTAPPPLIEELLATLQDEVLPIRFRGNCQFLLNRLAADRWHAVLINNEGVIKHTLREETLFLPCYDSTVTLDAPAGVTAREVFVGADLEVAAEGGRTRVSVVVPAGQVRVVEFRAVRL